MNGPENDANAELDALGAAYQGGGISRDVYRARRRRVINALRARNDVTERKPIIVDEPPRATAPSGSRHMRSLSRERPWHALRWLALAATVATGILAVVWLVWGIKGGVR